MNKYVEKIIDIAKEKKIPLSQICTDVEINKNSFNNWKNGSEPSLDKIIKIIKYLEISADDVFETQIHTTTTKETKMGKIKFTESEFESLEIVLGSLDSYLLGHLTKDCKDKNADDISEDIGRIYNKLVRAKEQNEPFYSENNIQHLENKMKEYKAGRLQLAEHELIED